MIAKAASAQPDLVLVTFTVPPTSRVESVHLVGDFNGWNRHSHPLVQIHDGSWQITLELAIGRAYQFRYLVNGEEWRNDWNADRYTTNPFGGENSVVQT